MIYSWLWDGERDWPLLLRLRRLVEHPNFNNRSRETQLALRSMHTVLVQRHTNWLLAGQRKGGSREDRSG
jgi:hypothetical protein